MPQERVLEPVLYTLFTEDLQQNEATWRATFVDDSAVPVKRYDPTESSKILQERIDQIQN